MGSPLSDDERATLKAAAFGAVFLVANADPGVLAMVTESFAASRAIAGASGLVRQVLTTGPLPALPDSPAEVERSVLPALRRSIEILQTKAPDEVENYRSIVVDAAERTAQASEGVSGNEADAIGRIRGALGVTPG